jgi:hypothetical protein
MALSRFPPSASSQRLMILAASCRESASSSPAALSVGMPATICACVSTGRPDSAVSRGPVPIGWPVFSRRAGGSWRSGLNEGLLGGSGWLAR